MSIPDPGLDEAHIKTAALVRSYVGQHVVILDGGRGPSVSIGPDELIYSDQFRAGASVASQRRSLAVALALLEDAVIRCRREMARCDDALTPRTLHLGD